LPSLAHEREIVIALQGYPELGCRPQSICETRGGVGTNRASTFDDLRDPLRRNASGLGELVGGNSEALDVFGPEHFAWMGWGLGCHAHSVAAARGRDVVAYSPSADLKCERDTMVPLRP
jgi:hypothetical protein